MKADAPEYRPSGHLEQKFSIAPLVEQDIFRRPPNGKAAEYEGPARESQRLVSLLSLQTDQFDAVGLLRLLLRYFELAGEVLEQLARGPICQMLIPAR
jgi:hypothetical protein